LNFVTFCKAFGSNGSLPFGAGDPLTTLDDTMRSHQVRYSPIARVLLLLSLPFAFHCGGGEGEGPDLQPRAFSRATVVQTCTAQNIRGFPIQAKLCGGLPETSSCEPGALYDCKGGKQGDTNNCKLLQACPIGCETNPNSSATCYTGPAPLAITPTSTPGGSEVTATVTLPESHPNGAIDNMRIDRGDLVAARVSCNVLDVPAAASSVSFNLPTAVVSSPAPVRAYTFLSFATPTGFARSLVSRSTTVTLNPGGTAPPPPPISSFTLTPSSVAPGGVSFMNVTLAHMASAQALPAPQGLPIRVTSSDPTVASVIANGQPVILPGCTTGGGAETIQAAKSVSQTTSVNISATSGDPGSTVVTDPLTVTAGCTPRSCVDLPAGQCTAPDGCGGTLACGCPGGAVCGSTGMCEGAPVSAGVSSVTLNPSTTTGGASSTGTAALNIAAPAGGLAVFLASSSAAANVPGSVVVPEGQTSASFNVTTSRVGSTTVATITAQSNGSASAGLTISP
jgi:hypothetical protein